MSLNLIGAVPSEFTAGTSPVAELLTCLHVLAEPEHHPEARTWVSQIRAALPPDLAAQLSALSPFWARFRLRVLFPFSPPLDRSFHDEVAGIAELDAKVFIPSAAIAIRGTSQDDLPDRSDPLSRDTFIEACDRRSFARGELARRLMGEWTSLRTDLVDSLGKCWDVFFADEWSRIGPHLGEVAARVRTQLQRDPLAEVLASLSPTAVATRGNGSVRYDKLQVATATVSGPGCLIIPTVHGWPHLILKIDEPEHPLVVHFLSADWEQRVPITQNLIRDRLAALAEPGRWELVRHLVNEPITTSELARRTGLTPPQVSRHLRRLREVGLISSQREGRMVHHRLHTRLMLTLGRDALTTLMR